MNMKGSTVSMFIFTE